MKIKMLLQVILLAVLTIGAVGASDDISDDSLAVDNTQDSIGSHV